LENALKVLGKLATRQDKEQRWKRPRLLAVFSDRTQASWEAKAISSLQALVDQVPPTYERLPGLQAGLSELMPLLAELRQRLPLAEPDLNDQLDKLRSQITAVRADDYPDPAATTEIAAFRPRVRELLAALPADNDQLSQEARDYRT